MKTIKTNEMSVEQFADIFDFVQTIEKRKNNIAMKGQDSSIYVGDQNFYGTQSYEESIDIMERGYKEGVRQILAVKPQMRTNRERSRQTIGLVGYAPHVPNAIIGNPFSMITSKPVKEPVKEVQIVYDRSASKNVPANKLAQVARGVLDAVSELEKRSIRVTLYVARFDCDDKHGIGEKVGMMVKIKDAKQPLNLLKVAYPLVHSSFVRRQGFRWMETSPIVTSRKFRNSYGYNVCSFGRSMDIRHDMFVRNGVIRKQDAFIDFSSLHAMKISDGATILQIIEKQINRKS